MFCTLIGYDNVHLSENWPVFISAVEDILAVKGFRKCDFELLHVRSQFDQCLLQISLASGHSKPLIDESSL